MGTHTTETGRPRIQRQESKRKAERTWSHSFLLGDFAGTACCSQRSSEFRSQLFLWKPQILQLKVSFTILQ